MISCLASEYDILKMPRFPGDFDVYESNGLSIDDEYTIVTQDGDIKVGKSFLCRLHYGQLGLWHAVCKRIASKKYRVLWVGKMPPSMALDLLT